MGAGFWLIASRKTRPIRLQSAHEARGGYGAQRRPAAATALRSSPRRPSGGYGAPQQPAAATALRSGPRCPAAAQGAQRRPSGGYGAPQRPSGPAAAQRTSRLRRRLRRRRPFGDAPRRRCRLCHPATPGSVGTLPPGPRFRPPTSPRARRWQPKAPSCPKSGQQLPKRAAVAQKVGSGCPSAQQLPKKWAAAAVAQARSSCPKSGQSRHRLSGARQAGGAQPPPPGTPGGRCCRQGPPVAGAAARDPGGRCPTSPHQPPPAPGSRRRDPRGRCPTSPRQPPPAPGSRHQPPAAPGSPRQPPQGPPGTRPPGQSITLGTRPPVPSDLLRDRCDLALFDSTCPTSPKSCNDSATRKPCDIKGLALKHFVI